PPPPVTTQCSSGPAPTRSSSPSPTPTRFSSRSPTPTRFSSRSPAPARLPSLTSVSRHRPRRRAFPGQRHRERRGGALNLDALFLQDAQQVGLCAGPRVVGGEHVRGRPFGARLEDRALAFQIVVAQEQLAVRLEVMQRG